MRRSVITLAVMAAVVLGAAVPALTAAAQLPAAPVAPAAPLPVATPVDVVGVLVDAACYATRGVNAMAAAHTKCAMVCAQKGHRLAIVTATGDVYVVTGALTQDNNAKLLPVMNRPIVLTGTVSIRVLQTTAVPAPAPTLDRRRPAVVLDEVVAKITVRQGDFREGDVPNAATKIIEAISFKLVAVPVPAI